MLAGGGAIKVEVDSDLPKSLSEPLSKHMVESLWKENVPASTLMSFSPRYLLQGELKILNSSLFKAEEVEIVWLLTEVKKKTKYKFTYKISGERPGWLLLDENPLMNLPTNMGKDIVKHLYKVQGLKNSMLKLNLNSQTRILRKQLNLPEELSISSNNSHVDSLVLSEKPKVFLTGIMGAPGDGNIFLYKKMRRMLIIAGLNVVNIRRGSTFLLNGFVNISPTYDGLRDVAITWLVTTEDGKVVGKSTQNNKVSKGSLNMEWGKVVEDVVLKGSTAILDIMMKYLTLHNIKN